MLSQTFETETTGNPDALIITRGCGCWGAARYGAVLAVEYTRAVLGLSRSVCSCSRGYRPSHRNTTSTDLFL